MIDKIKSEIFESEFWNFVTIQTQMSNVADLNLKLILFGEFPFHDKRLFGTL